MNSALHSTPTAARPERKRIVQPFWLATLGFVACVAVAAGAAATVPMAAWAPGSTSNAAGPVTAALPLVAAVANPHLSTRCQTCGVVQIVRKLKAVGVSAASYELTVRLRDGTTRISSHSGPVGWRVGDSIMLIGDARVAAPV
jgi:hypothetical protein